MNNNTRLSLAAFAAALGLMGLTSCSHTAPVAQKKYPPLSSNSPDAQLQKHIQESQGQQQGRQGGQ